MSALCKLDGVTVLYGGVRALSDLSLCVPEGSVVALLGANGAGKSTTLRAISGLVRLETGRVIFDGSRLDGLAPHLIARAGVLHVPEGRGIFPSLTVRENLEMVSFTRSGTANPVEAGVEIFPALGGRLGQAAGSLSGGEQQMLSLSRAFIASPRLLMVDEISMGLAPIIVAELFGALRSMASAGTSVLLVEQYVNAALELADYVYLLDKGRLVEVAEPGELRREGLLRAYLGREATNMEVSAR